MPLASGFKHQRWIFVFSWCIVTFVRSILNSHINITLLFMTSMQRGKQTSNTSECPRQSEPAVNNSAGQPREFAWNEQQLGYVIAAFPFGCIFSQIAAGYAVTKFGGKIVTTCGIFSCSAISLLTPLAVNGGVGALAGMRFLLGFASCTTRPAMYTMLSAWSPKKSRTTMLAFVLIGTDLGSMVELPLAMSIASSPLLNGWSSVFYCTGLLGLLSLAVWIPLAYDSPASHPWITREERNMIEADQQAPVVASKVPWMKLLFSRVSIAIHVSAFANFWLKRTRSASSFFYDTVMGFSRANNSFYLALATSPTMFFSLLVGILTNRLINAQIMSLTAVRKMQTAISLLATAGFLMLASIADCDLRPATVVCFVLASCFNKVFRFGAKASVMDVTRNHSGMLIAISNTIALTASWIQPLVLGYFTNEDPSRSHYRNVFLVATGIASAACVVYLLFGSAEKAAWDDENYTEVNQSNDWLPEK